MQYFDRKVVNKFKDREDQTIGTDSKDRTYGHTDTRDHAYVYVLYAYMYVDECMYYERYNNKKHRLRALKNYAIHNTMD